MNGWGFGFNLIVYSSPNLPRPVNSEGYCEIILLSTEHTFDNNCNALMVGSPKGLFFKLLTMNTR